MRSGHNRSQAHEAHETGRSAKARRAERQGGCSVYDDVRHSDEKGALSRGLEENLDVLDQDMRRRDGTAQRAATVRRILIMLVRGVVVVFGRSQILRVSNHDRRSFSAIGRMRPRTDSIDGRGHSQGCRRARASKAGQRQHHDSQK